MIRAFASGMSSVQWRTQLKVMIEAHSLPYEAAQVAFTLNPEPMKFVLEGKRGPRGGRGKFFYNEDDTWPLRWTEMHERGQVHCVWPILKRMKGRLDGARLIGFDMANPRSSPTGQPYQQQLRELLLMYKQEFEDAIRSLAARKGAFDDTR